MKRTELKRKKRINPISERRRSRRGTPGKLSIVRLDAAGMRELRLERFRMDGYRCQWKVGDGICGVPVTWEGFSRGHLAHIVSRGRGGSDTLENTRTLCEEHHLVAEHNPKPCPAKPRSEAA